MARAVLAVAMAVSLAAVLGAPGPARAGGCAEGPAYDEPGFVIGDGGDCNIVDGAAETSATHELEQHLDDLLQQIAANWREEKAARRAAKAAEVRRLRIAGGELVDGARSLLEILHDMTGDPRFAKGSALDERIGVRERTASDHGARTGPPLSARRTEPRDERPEALAMRRVANHTITWSNARRHRSSSFAACAMRCEQDGSCRAVAYEAAQQMCDLITDFEVFEAPTPDDVEVAVKVARLPTLGLGGWSGNLDVQVGAYRTQALAEERLAVAQSVTGGRFTVGGVYLIHVDGAPVYRARFEGFSPENARYACRKMQRKGIDCWIDGGSR